MGRPKKEYKNETISVSLPADQIRWIKANPSFNLSKFVQLDLHDYINLWYSLSERRSK